MCFVKNIILVFKKFNVRTSTKFGNTDERSHGVMENARKLGERNWRNTARNRDRWQKLLKKALAQKGLLCCCC